MKIEAEISPFETLIYENSSEEPLTRDISKIRKLEIKSPSISVKFLMETVKKMPQLEHLIINHFQIEHEDLKKIILSCRSLKVLCNYNNTKLFPFNITHLKDLGDNLIILS